MSKSSLRDSIAQDFVAALQEDQLPWQKMWAKQRAYNAATGNDYHGINAMWLAWQASQHGYEDPRWCTYKQAQDHGWQVRKGEKATAVEFWSLYDTKTRKTITMEEADKLVRDDPDRKDDLTYITKRASVFNAAQIDGIPKLERPLAVDMDTIVAQRDTLLKNMGVGLREGGDQAYYEPASDTIAMPSGHAFVSDYSYMSVLLHEAGHATGHQSRLNRDLSGGFGSESYAKEELRAEIASAFTAQALGLQGEDDEPAMQAYMANHKAYIQSWCKAIQDAPQELFAAIKDAEKISDYLIEKGEFERAPKPDLAMDPEIEQKVIAAMEEEYVPAEMRGLYEKLLAQAEYQNPEMSAVARSCMAMSTMRNADYEDDEVPEVSQEWAGRYMGKAQELRKGFEQEQKQNAGKAVVEELLQKAYARTGDSRGQDRNRSQENVMTH